MGKLHKQHSLWVAARLGLTTDPESGWTVSANTNWWGTPNQDRGLMAAAAWFVYWLVARGANPNAGSEADRVCRAISAVFVAESKLGWCRGESFTGYSSQHVAGVLGLAEALASLLTVHDTPAVRECWNRVVGWIGDSATLALEWLDLRGCVCAPGPRAKINGPEAENARGSELLAYWAGPRYEGRVIAAHPYVAQRMRLPLTHDFWMSNATHQRLIVESLHGEFGAKLRDVVKLGRFPRTSFPIHWGRSPDGRSLIVVSEWISSNGDGDGRQRKASEAWRFRPPRTYERLTDFGDEIGNGFNGIWEYSTIAGEEPSEVRRRHVQGVGGIAQVPHPEMTRQQVMAEIVSTEAKGWKWKHVGPDAPVLPVEGAEHFPWKPGARSGGGGGGGGGGNPGPERRPIVPRWQVRKWLSRDTPAWAVNHLPEILWQAQRMEQGEVEAEGLLVKAVERMNEGRRDA